MTEATSEPTAQTRPPVRRLGQLCGLYHNVTYYTPDDGEFRKRGLGRYWHRYLAYRAAPMGPVAASVVVATFYNFAPQLVGAAIPRAWSLVSPAEAIALRDAAVDRALRSAFAGSGTDDGVSPDTLAEAASLLRSGLQAADAGARPLFGAHTELPWPTAPHLELYLACTLWREHRGDGHNLVLAANRLDGIECHVLLAGRGVGDAATIEKIRGWSRSEWDRAAQRLLQRGLIDDDGRCTDAGLALRRRVEDETDRLAMAPIEKLGEDGTARLLVLLEPIAQRLVDRGAVSGTWPPKNAELLGSQPGVVA